MASKDERERAALAARAAARAQLSAAGQVLPQAYGAAMPGGGVGVGGGAGLTEQTRSLLAACKAAGLDTTGRPSAGASSSSGSSNGGGGWVQAPQGFYFHPPSGVAQWAAPPAASAQPPAPLPQGWFLADSAEGPYYYTASFTNARGVVGQLRTWERPSAPPATGALTAGM
jgi:hypothetical protein